MKLLVTGAWRDAGRFIPEIEQMGHEVVFLQQEKDPLPADPGTIEGIVGNGLFLYHPMEDFSALRFVQLTSAGFDRVPMDLAAARGVKVLNARGVYSVPMAEFAAAGVLALYKRTILFHNNQKEHSWIKLRDLPELGGRTAAVFGCGSVGTECAKRFAAFDMRVMGVDAVLGERPYFEKIVPVSEADRVLREADVVLSALPHLPETVHFFNAERFLSMKDGAVFVNISRGAVADTAALAGALRSGKLMGAVLDVFEEEPLPSDSVLWDMDNVLVTPHNSFSGEGNAARLSELIMRNIRGLNG